MLDRLLDRLSRLSRRTIYLVLFVAAGLPFLVPIRLPLYVWNETRSAWQITDSCPPDKVVLINSQWIAGSQGENWPQYEAVVSHCMARGIPFVVFALDADPQAPQMAEVINERQAARYGRVYGRDWVNLGLSRGAPLTMGSIGRSLKSVYPRDYRGFATTDADKLPILRGIDSLAHFHCLWVIDYQANLDWLVFLDPSGELPILFATAGIVSTGYYPYISSGQLDGMLVGVRGAAEYENLTAEALGERYDRTGLRGNKLLVPLAFGHLIIILFIVAGNLGLLARRKRRDSRRPS